MEDTEPVIAISMQLEDIVFTATGPRSDVLRLYAEWKKLAGFALDSKTAPALDLRTPSERGN